MSNYIYISIISLWILSTFSLSINSIYCDITICLEIFGAIFEITIRLFLFINLMVNEIIFEYVLYNKRI